MARGNACNDICLTCRIALESDTVGVQCVECGYKYHLGNCSGVTDAAFRNKKQNYVDTWKCQTCRAAKARSKSAQEEKDRNTEGAELQSQLAEIAKTLAILGPLKEKVDELASIKGTVLEIEKSIQLMSDQYDKILKKMSDQERETTELKRRVENLEKSQKTDEVAKLKRDLNSLEQYGRLNNLEVHGLKVTEGENLLGKLNKISEIIHVSSLSNNDIEIVHRIPSKTGKIPPVIVRFVRRETRNDWLKNRNKLRSSIDGYDTVYLQENLTELNRKLFFDARAEAKAIGYRYVWHKGGCTYVRKNEGDPAVRIESEHDLNKIK